MRGWEGQHSAEGEGKGAKGDRQGTESIKYRMDRVQNFLYKVQNGQSSEFSVFSNIGLGLGLG